MNVSCPDTDLSGFHTTQMPELSEQEGICLLDSTSGISRFPLRCSNLGLGCSRQTAVCPSPATLPVFP